jgi:hypothetical protein
MATATLKTNTGTKTIQLVGSLAPSGGSSMFSSRASGILPTVYKGTANSEFTLNFESSAVGALIE